VGYVALITTTRVVVRDPGLFAERAQMRKDAKGWDKALVAAALDARFGWSPAVSAVGLAALLLGFGLSVWAMAANRFFSSFVRIQTVVRTALARGARVFAVREGYEGAVAAAESSSRARSRIDVGSEGVGGAPVLARTQRS
jgi:hypothetical protein